MSDATKVEIPELTQDQKMAILLVQRQILNAKVTVNDTIKNIEAMSNSLNQLVSKFASDLKLDPTTITFDMDNLKFNAK